MINYKTIYYYFSIKLYYMCVVHLDALLIESASLTSFQVFKPLYQ